LSVWTAPGWRLAKKEKNMLNEMIKDAFPKKIPINGGGGRISRNKFFMGYSSMKNFEQFFSQETTRVIR
jgi:hypothetical protein